MSYHQFIIVNAIPGAVYSLASSNAEQHGTVLLARRPQVLVAQTEGICYVYAFNVVSGPVQKTRLDLAITRDAAAAVACAEASDVVAAMDGLPDDISAHDAELAQTHLDTLRRLISPIPEAVVAKKAHEAQQEQERAPLHDGPVVTLGNVWFFFAIAGGIFSAALLLALNWWNMGQRRKALITPLIVLLPWIAFSFLLVAVFNTQSFSSRFGYAILPFVFSLLVSAGLLFWQIRQQQPLYAVQVTEHGKPSTWAMRNIAMVFTVVVIGCLIGYRVPDALTQVWPESATALVPFVPVADLDVYKDESLTIQYPSDWNNLAKDHCNPSVTCLIAKNQRPIWGVMYVERVVSSGAPLEDLLTGITIKSWFTEEDADISGFQTFNKSSFEIDGRSAVQVDLSYTTTITWGFWQTFKHPRFGRAMFIDDGQTVIFVIMDVPVSLTNTVNAIFDSVHFLTPAP